MDADVERMNPKTKLRPSDRIVDAARQLFFTSGYANTQLRAIANLAGTSETGILRVFSSKAGVLVAVYGWCWHRINSHVESELGKTAKVNSDPRNLLGVIIRSLLDLYDQEHEMMAFIVSNYNSVYDPRNLHPESSHGRIDLDTFADAFFDHVALVDALCSQAVSEGLVPAGISARALREFVLAVPHGVHQGWLMVEQNGYGTKVTTEEIMALVKSFLYTQSES